MNRFRAIATRAVPRVAAIALLAWTFGVLGLVGAVHSVHHLLDDGAEAGHCVIAAADQHAEGNAADVPQIAGLVAAPHERPPSSFPALPPSAAFRPDEGRAPPPAASA